MQFQFLSAALHPTAAEVVNYFRQNLGLGGFKAEQAIDDEIEFKPALHAVSKDHHIICVEVSETLYPPSLDAFILACKNKSVPAKLYVATPTGYSQTEFRAAFQRAKDNGVGLLEVTGNQVKAFHLPLSQSLSGLRRVQLANFPAKYREPLFQAQQTFLDGDPVKGCAGVYDELENLSRRVAIKANDKGFWHDPAKVPNVNFETHSWAKLLEILKDHLNRQAAGCANLNDALYYRILGVTAHRNDAGHKPNSVARRKKRDAELRTRFEHATDMLLDLTKAASPLRV